MSSQSSNSSTTQNHELSLHGLIPSSPPIHYEALIQKLQSISLTATSYTSDEVILRPLAQNGPGDERLLRVRSVREGKERADSYLVSYQQPESAKTSPSATITPVVYSLIGGGQDGPAFAFAEMLGYQKSAEYTKQGTTFGLSNGLKIEVYQLDSDSSSPWIVELCSPPSPYGAMARYLEFALAAKKELVSFVSLGRV